MGNGATLRSGAASPAARAAGLVAFQRGRKQDNYGRLLAAAAAKFCAQGYVGVSVDEIAAAAGVSRMTFYRHFASKAVLAIELFKTAAEAAMPHFIAIGKRDFRDRAAVMGWLEDLFVADSSNRQLLRVFNQAVAFEESFKEQAQELIRELIMRLGETIPAFAVSPDKPDERRCWLQAWLLLFEILEQSNHAALNSGIANDPLVIEILSEKFLSFVA